MKLFAVLIIACCAIITHSSDSPKSNEQLLLQRASAQLERLAPYRRINDQLETQSSSMTISPEDIMKNELLIAQIYQGIPKDLQEEVMRRIDEKNRGLLNSITDPEYLARMQERIKRAGTDYGGYGPDSYGGEEYGGYEHGGDSGYGHKDSGSGSIISGSGSIISGIASGILGGIASASAGASKASFSGSAQASGASSSGSSHKETPYGHSYPHEEKHFGVWDFKKAIINTLVQAIKAISGGVIALKGQLIKGSGYLVSTKGKIITSTGEAISSLGRHIAKSAVVTNAPKHPEYAYGPPAHHDDHEITYEGPPPPTVNEYGHDDYSGNSHYNSPSDDGDDHAGLLIVKPTKPDYNHQESPPLDVDPRKPHLTHTETDYNSPPAESHDENNGPEYSYGPPNTENHVDSYHLTQSPTSYDVPLHYTESDKENHHYPLYPPLHQDSHNLGNHLTVQQSVEYPPIHIQYTNLPNKNLNNVNSIKPGKDLSVYSSFSIGLNPHLESLKLIKHGNHFELPKVQAPVNFHGLSGHEPLKIPLLNPLPVNYWYGHGYMEPSTGFMIHRRRTSNEKRRRVSEGNARNSMSASKNTRVQRA